MSRDLKWNKGAPERLEPGMVVLDGQGEARLIGDFEFVSFAIQGVEVSAWAWVVQPYELEWQESMAKAHGVGK